MNVTAWSFILMVLTQCLAETTGGGLAGFTLSTVNKIKYIQPGQGTKMIKGIQSIMYVHSPL